MLERLVMLGPTGRTMKFIYSRYRYFPWAFALVISLAAQSAVAALIDITVHEDGTGTSGNLPLTSTQEQDPGPGGLANALTFNLGNPPNLIAGDLFLLDPVTMQISDVIRFNPQQHNGSLVFYSLPGGGELADTGFPSANYSNTFSIIENTLGETIYTPTQGQPGLVANATGFVSYHIVSTEAANGVPEGGSTVMLMLSAVGALAALRRRS